MLERSWWKNMQGAPDIVEEVAGGTFLAHVCEKYPCWSSQVGLSFVGLLQQMQDVGMQVVEGAIGPSMEALFDLTHQYCGQEWGPDMVGPGVLSNY